METLVAKTAGDLALQGSGWAVAVLLGIACLLLYRELRAGEKKYTDLLERVIVVAEGSKASCVAAAAAIEGIRNTVVTLTNGVEGLSREAEGAERETRHGLANLMQVINAVVERLTRLSDQGRQ